MATLTHEVKTPDSFHYSLLLGEDFDGTVGLTSETSPRGIDVEGAYVIAVKNVFGLRARDQYIDAGGLLNRAPSEVVQQLAPDAGSDFDPLVDQLVDAKLAVLLDEIGTTFEDGSVWPRPTDGYLDFQQSLTEGRKEGLLIDDLILTSGHEVFIRQTYAAWCIEPPTHIVAEETIRQMALELPVEQLVKPSPLLMEVVHNVWRQSYGLEPSDKIPENVRQRMIYVGNDPAKDGELALNSGVDFVLIDPTTARQDWQSVASKIGLGRSALTDGLR
jgi:hypothetical protein